MIYKSRNFLRPLGILITIDIHSIYKSRNFLRPLGFALMLCIFYNLQE